MSDAQDRIAEIKRKTEEKRKKLVRLAVPTRRRLSLAVDWGSGRPGFQPVRLAGG